MLYAGIRCTVGAKCPWLSWLFGVAYACVRMTETACSRMKPARSNTQGGNSSPSPDRGQAEPLRASSASASLLFLMFFRTVQAWFAAGAVHTRPVQSVSCQGTRADRCEVGNSTAPGEKAMILPGLRGNGQGGLAGVLDAAPPAAAHSISHDHEGAPSFRLGFAILPIMIPHPSGALTSGRVGTTSLGCTTADLPDLRTIGRWRGVETEFRAVQGLPRTPHHAAFEFGVQFGWSDSNNRCLTEMAV